jgi:hypothetical protein
MCGADWRDGLCKSMPIYFFAVQLRSCLSAAIEPRTQTLLQNGRPLMLRREIGVPLGRPRRSAGTGRARRDNLQPDTKSPWPVTLFGCAALHWQSEVLAMPQSFMFRTVSVLRAVLAAEGPRS